MANDTRVERNIGRTWVRIGDKEEMTIVVFEPGGAGVLLGAYTLEGLALAVDPLGRRLVPTEGLLMMSDN